MSRGRRNTRALAADVLTDVLRKQVSLTVSLERLVSNVSDPQERSFVKSICFGTLRWYYRLDFLLNSLLDKPLKHKDTDIRALALLGLYQLAYTRVKPHAAVAETVAAARRKSWARPLLNAVLRTYQRERSALEERADRDELAATAHPQWLLAEIRQQWPHQLDEICRQNNQQPPMVLRVNRLQTTRESYLDLLKAANIEGNSASAVVSAIQLSTAVDVAVLPGFCDGMASVQDGAAQLAAHLLDLRPGHRVLDACAAPGGKTVHILESCPELSELVAADVDPRRAQRIEENLDRAGMRASVCVCDMTEPPDGWGEQRFDRILLDAPCSATGVIRRHPDIRILRTPSDIGQLCEIQQKLLESTWALLKPAGVLLYSTCSVLGSENHLQITRFLSTHSEAREWKIDADWGQECTYGRQILPGDQGMDGFYYARLVREQ